MIQNSILLFVCFVPFVIASDELGGVAIWEIALAASAAALALCLCSFAIYRCYRTQDVDDEPPAQTNSAKSPPPTSVATVAPRDLLVAPIAAPRPLPVAAPRPLPVATPRPLTAASLTKKTTDSVQPLKEDSRIPTMYERFTSYQGVKVGQQQIATPKRWLKFQPFPEDKGGPRTIFPGPYAGTDGTNAGSKEQVEWVSANMIRMCKELNGMEYAGQEKPFPKEWCAFARRKKIPLPAKPYSGKTKKAPGKYGTLPEEVAAWVEENINEDKRLEDENKANENQIV